MLIVKKRIALLVAALALAAIPIVGNVPMVGAAPTGDAPVGGQECGVEWNHVKDSRNVRFVFPLKTQPDDGYMRGVLLYTSEEPPDENGEFARFKNQIDGSPFGTIIVRHTESEAGEFRYYRAQHWVKRGGWKWTCEEFGAYRIKH